MTNKRSNKTKSLDNTASQESNKTQTHTRFKLMDDIKSNELYKQKGRDPKARDIIEENIKNATKNDIFPGQMLMFKYFNPKTKEDLEFYDAYPCTIFFGTFNSKEGQRVLGFNIHYLPPLLRYRVMDKIYELFRPSYTKYFDEGLNHEIDAFDYKFLIEELERVNLGWTVKMYIPSLIGDVRVIPPKFWSTAIMTEGWFKKDTRAHIMQLFKQESKKKGKITTRTHSHGKRNKNKKK